MPPASAPARAMRFGAATGLRPLPAWKRAADFLFVQIGFSLDALLAWRAQVDVDVPVYAGVIVVASPAMARSRPRDPRRSTVPPGLVERLERDRNAGVDAGLRSGGGIRDSGAFDGVHLIPVARYREVAARLERCSDVRSLGLVDAAVAPQPPSSSAASSTSSSESTTRSASPKAGC